MIPFMISVVPPKIDCPRKGSSRIAPKRTPFESYDAFPGPSGIINCANASE